MDWAITITPHLSTFLKRMLENDLVDNFEELKLRGHKIEELGR